LLKTFQDQSIAFNISSDIEKDLLETIQVLSSYQKPRSLFFHPLASKLVESFN